MTRAIHSTYTNYIGAASIGYLHTAPGLVRAIIATCDSTTPAGCALYDNTAASGNVLINVQVSTYSPVIIILPYDTPLRFLTALTVSTGTGVRAFIVTEA